VLFYGCSSLSDNTKVCTSGQTGPDNGHRENLFHIPIVACTRIGFNRPFPLALP
jgi:hypothetical protein